MGVFVGAVVAWGAAAAAFAVSTESLAGGVTVATLTAGAFAAVWLIKGIVASDLEDPVEQEDWNTQAAWRNTVLIAVGVGWVVALLALLSLTAMGFFAALFWAILPPAAGFNAGYGLVRLFAWAMEPFRDDPVRDEKDESSITG